MRLAVLGSGSSGNVAVVDWGSQRLLLDAGLSCREIEKRLRSVGLEPRGFAGVLLTHEHSDHIRGAARFAGRHEVPVYATAGTLSGLDFGRYSVRTVTIRSGRPVEIGPFLVQPFEVPHDAREPIGFVVEDPAGRRLGLAADLGARSRAAWGYLTDLDLLILETNHDVEMLRSGPYPWPLKQRIASRHGHLSNHEAAEGLAELIGDRLKWVVLYHLSRTNNAPSLAVDAVGQVLARAGASTRICVSGQFEPTPWLEIEERAEPLRVGAGGLWAG